MSEFILINLIKKLEGIMHIVINEHVVHFLQSEKVKILKEWSEQLKVQPGDIYADHIVGSGAALFEILIDHSFQSSEKLNELIKELALKVAEQRVQADINIGDFVHNVNIGRKVLLKYLFKTEIPAEDLPIYIDFFNDHFDKFLYNSVAYYSETQNKIIREKTQFIDSTHKDRLTLLGQMTSSFIHEFRNPLTSIQGFIQLLKADHPKMKYLDIISNELEQLNFRISQFLLLSKKELIGKEKVKFSLNELIEEVLIFLYPSILDGKVKIIKHFEADIILEGYEDEIRQVLINIIFNAIDVLSPDRVNPIIEIISRQEDDDFIKVEIANNGPQIPENLVSTIFEPFFTTKTLGTGLGLFVCKEIIEKHRGALTCQSAANKTVFAISLPISKI